MGKRKISLQDAVQVDLVRDEIVTGRRTHHRRAGAGRRQGKACQGKYGKLHPVVAEAVS